MAVVAQPKVFVFAQIEPEPLPNARFHVAEVWAFATKLTGKTFGDYDAAKAYAETIEVKDEE